MNKQDLVNKFLHKGFLLSPDFLDNFNLDQDNFFKILNKKLGDQEKPLVLTKDLLNIFQRADFISEINWFEFEKSRAFLEKGRNGKVYKTFLNILNYGISKEKKDDLDRLMKEVRKPEARIVLDKEEECYSNVIVLKNYEDKDKKREVGDFISYFRYRYDALRKILQKRSELQEVVSINRVLNKKDKENVSIIGIVDNKRVTKAGNIVLDLEDNTGKISVIVKKEEKELFGLASNVVFDEVLGIKGLYNNKFIFCDSIYFPSFPEKELKKVKDDVYAVFTADMHFGNKRFLLKDFIKFIDWLNGKTGDRKQKEISTKVKYLFIVGDVVDGVGVFPGQEEELLIKDIYSQYEKCAELLGRIRKDINIVICAGNHDALRISEPQPFLDKNLAKPVWDLPNVTIVTNPSLVNIHSSKDFEGFNLLLYHGSSFQYYADNVESIRMAGGTTRADLIMKLLLEKRHLAPSHTSTLYIPDNSCDPLIIEKIPDFFVTGHIHRTSVSNYKGVTLIGCGCWIPQTPFQERVGLHPEPSKVPLVNLKTREVQIMDFSR